jgi:hypothetical protein
MPILIKPSDAPCTELSSSIIWFDDTGILNSCPKEGLPIVSTRAQMEEDMKKFQEISKGKKMLLLIEAHPKADSPPPKDRDYIAEKLTLVTHAMAILTSSAASMMVSNVFFLLNPPAYPIKMFVSETEARKWLLSKKTNKPPRQVIFAA